MDLTNRVKHISKLYDDNTLMCFNMLYEDIVKGSIFIYYEVLFTNTITNEKFVKIGVTTTSITCRYT
jgi:hypothetical protein